MMQDIEMSLTGRPTGIEVIDNKPYIVVEVEEKMPLLSRTFFVVSGMGLKSSPIMKLIGKFELYDGAVKRQVLEQILTPKKEDGTK